MIRRIAVVGGGLAGLVAAIQAARAGARVTLFESISELGGRARTREEAGFLFNMGPHALYRHGAAARVLGELGVSVPGGVPPTSGSLARFAGELHALPGGLVSLLTTGLLGLSEKLEAGRFLARLPKLDVSRYDHHSLAQGLDAELRHPRVRALVRALVRLSSYVHAPDLISAGAALAQAQLALASSVRYLDGGWQRLVEALAGAAHASGVEIRTAARARAVAFETGRVTGLCLADDSRVDADAVVLAVAPAEASSMVERGSDPLLQRFAAAPPVRVASLDVGLRGLPVPRRRFCLGIDEPLYFSVHSAVAELAPPGAALIHVARYLAPDEKPERAELQGQLEGLLDQMQPGWRERVVCQKLLTDLRVSHAVPTAAAGGLAGRAAARVVHRPGLFLAGDWVGPEGLLADASFASGRAAGLAAAGVGDPAVAA